MRAQAWNGRANASRYVDVNQAKLADIAPRAVKNSDKLDVKKSKKKKGDKDEGEMSPEEKHEAKLTAMTRHPERYL